MSRQPPSQPSAPRAYVPLLELLEDRLLPSLSVGPAIPPPLLLSFRLPPEEWRPLYAGRLDAADPARLDRLHEDTEPSAPGGGPGPMEGREQVLSAAQHWGGEPPRAHGEYHLRLGDFTAPFAVPPQPAPLGPNAVPQAAPAGENAGTLSATPPPNPQPAEPLRMDDLSELQRRASTFVPLPAPLLPRDSERAGGPGDSRVPVLTPAADVRRLSFAAGVEEAIAGHVAAAHELLLPDVAVPLPDPMAVALSAPVGIAVPRPPARDAERDEAAELAAVDEPVRPTAPEPTCAESWPAPVVEPPPRRAGRTVAIGFGVFLVLTLAASLGRPWRETARSVAAPGLRRKLTV